MQLNIELTDFGPTHLPSGRLLMSPPPVLTPPIKSCLPYLNLGRFAIRAARGLAPGTRIDLNVDSRRSTRTLFERLVRPWTSS